ncbi:MAG: hypothetical protein ABI675_25575 [Chitinophagaceae bacterium]
MKKNDKVKRTRKLTVRFSPDEFNKVNLSFKTTTKRKLSEYVRFVLLDKPVTVYTRNQSLDEFMAEMILLRNELSAIGNNFNQTVKRLHTMDRVADIKSWAAQNERSKEIFMDKVEEIKKRIAQFSDKWLQE